jgi:hypothetical protein
MSKVGVGVEVEVEVEVEVGVEVEVEVETRLNGARTTFLHARTPSSYDPLVKVERIDVISCLTC